MSDSRRNRLHVSMLGSVMAKGCNPNSLFTLTLRFENSILVQV
jgi:hypothetical protein